MYLQSCNVEARNIKYGQQIDLIQRGPLGTLLQEIATSLPHNHFTMTQIYLSEVVTEGVLLSNLTSKNKSFIEVHMSLLH